jgi:formylmethanofuran dehydrogenase subunit E
MIVGGFMVDLAKRYMPQGCLFDAVCETGHCLPDAIQLLTPCTIGNGWLRIVPCGRFALALFDKYEGHGRRVSLDHQAMQEYPGIREWFFKLAPKQEQDTNALLAEILEAGTMILCSHPVQIKADFLGKTSKGAIGICPGCNEAYPQKDGALCRACQNRSESPYVDSEDAEGLTAAFKKAGA